jgi:hypothetical protein
VNGKVGIIQEKWRNGLWKVREVRGGSRNVAEEINEIEGMGGSKKLTKSGRKRQNVNEVEGRGAAEYSSGSNGLENDQLSLYSLTEAEKIKQTQKLEYGTAGGWVRSEILATDSMGTEKEYGLPVTTLVQTLR